MVTPTSHEEIQGGIMPWAKNFISFLYEGMDQILMIIRAQKKALK